MTDGAPTEELAALRAEVETLRYAVALLIDTAPDRERLVAQLRDLALPQSGQPDMPAGLATVLNILSG